MKSVTKQLYIKALNDVLWKKELAYLLAFISGSILFILSINFNNYIEIICALKWKILNIFIFVNKFNIYLLED